MKNSSSKSYNLRPRFRLFPGSSQKKSATSQQIVEDYCDQCVREGNENEISSEICLRENADTTNTTNPPEGEIENQEPLNTDQSESPSILQALNTLSENSAIIPRPTAERTDPQVNPVIQVVHKKARNRYTKIPHFFPYQNARENYSKTRKK